MIVWQGYSFIDGLPAAFRAWATGLKSAVKFMLITTALNVPLILIADRHFPALLWSFQLVIASLAATRNKSILHREINDARTTTILLIPLLIVSFSVLIPFGLLLDFIANYIAILIEGLATGQPDMVKANIKEISRW